MTEAEERGACYGHPTLCVREMMEHMQECVVCGNAVRDDLVDHPFFGFRAGCDLVAAPLRAGDIKEG
jgi:hypothetical protein